MAEGSDNGGGGRPSNPGRRTEIKLIENRSSREVTFSKRRQGLFRKASELSVLCGAEIAILTYSPHGNPFPFSSSSVDAILQRFVGSTSEYSGSTAMAAPCEDRWVGEYCQQEKEALSRLRKMQEARRRDGGKRSWWEDPIEGMEVEELERFVEGMERLREAVGKRLEEMEKAATAAAPAPASVDSEAVIGLEEEVVPFESLMSESHLDLDFDYGAMS